MVIGAMVVVAASSVAGVSMRIGDAETQTAPVSADASVAASHPSRRSGRAPLLAIDTRRGGSIAFVSFTVEGCENGVDEARLQLRASPARTAGTSDGPRVYRVAGRLAERTVTWRTRPRMVREIVADAGRIAAGATVMLDVADAVPTDGTYTLALVPDVPDDVRFMSRESRFAPQVHYSCFLTDDEAPAEEEEESPSEDETESSEDPAAAGE